MNKCSFRILRAVTVWCSGQHTLDQTSKASYLFLHCFHSLQTMISAEKNNIGLHKTTHDRINIHRNTFLIYYLIYTSHYILKLTCCCQRLAQTLKSQRQMWSCHPPRGQLSETEVLNPSWALTLGSLQIQKKMWSLCGRFA